MILVGIAVGVFIGVIADPQFMTWFVDGLLRRNRRSRTKNRRNRL